MSFDAREYSTAEGQPIRLYDFTRGLRHWCYTTADRPISYAGRTYLPAGISDDGIRETGEGSADSLVVTGASAVMTLAARFRGVGPSSEIWLYVRDMHQGDDEAPVSWVGIVTDVSPADPGSVKFTCIPIAATMDQPGLRLCYSKNCTNALGDRWCGVELDTYRLRVSISALDGATLTVPAAATQPDGWWAGGSFEWEATDDSGEMETRGVEAHSGTLLTMLGGTFGLAAGQSGWLYPGCDLTLAMCHEKYGNAINYGGAPDKPDDNPYTGNAAF